MIIFILEVVGTAIVFLFLFYWIVWKPLATLAYLVRIIPYKLTKGKVNFFLREELVRMGLHKPGEGYYTADVDIRNRLYNPVEVLPPEGDDFECSITKIAIAFEDVGKSLNHYNPKTWDSRFDKKLKRR